MAEPRKAQPSALAGSFAVGPEDYQQSVDFFDAWFHIGLTPSEDDAVTGMRGFPYKTFPLGWYQIAWSQELKTGEVHPAKYFDQDLVVYRGESGNVVVMDAICRHMGANLGYGGKVDGDDIACPFHGWKWACNGAHLDIPYSQQAATKAKLRTWPAIEKSGLVLIWYDASGAQPSFEPPEVPEFMDPAYYPVYPEGAVKGEVPFPPQLVLENAVDVPHLHYVHNWDAAPPGMRTFEDRGDSFYVETFGAIKTGKGVAELNTKITAWSVGLIYSHLSGLRDMGFVSAMTPIDATRSEVRLTTAVMRGESGGDTLDKFAKAMVDAQVEEVLGLRPGGDRAIWEHMEYQANPVLAREEVAPWVALRNWAAKHYGDAPTPTSQKITPQLTAVS